MDTPAAIIFQTTNYLRKVKEQGIQDPKVWEILCSVSTSREEFLELKEDSKEWKQAVSCIISSKN